MFLYNFSGRISQKEFHLSLIDLRSDLGEFKGEKLFFFSEPSMVLTGVIISKKDNKKKPATMLLFENGTCDIEKEYRFIESFLNKEHLVLILDVRGVGGVKVRKINYRDIIEIYGSEFKLAYDAIMRTSTFSMRVFDVLRGFDYLKTRSDVDPEKIGIYGKGISSLYAFFAMAIEPKIRKGTFENMLLSYEDVVETRIYNRKVVNEQILVHGIFKYFNIIDLIPLLHKRKTKFINLIDATRNKASQQKI